MLEDDEIHSPLAFLPYRRSQVDSVFANLPDLFYGWPESFKATSKDCVSPQLVAPTFAIPLVIFITTAPLPSTNARPVPLPPRPFSDP